MSLAPSPCEDEWRDSLFWQTGWPPGGQGTTVYCLGAGWGSPHMARLEAGCEHQGLHGTLVGPFFGLFKDGLKGQVPVFGHGVRTQRVRGERIRPRNPRLKCPFIVGVPIELAFLTRPLPLCFNFSAKISFHGQKNMHQLILPSQPTLSYSCGGESHPQRFCHRLSNQQENFSRVTCCTVACWL